MASKTTHTARSLLEEFYDAERIYMSADPDKRDFSILAKFIAPDTLLTQTAALPYGGTHIGLEGFQNCAQQMADCMSEVDVQNAEIFESEDKKSNRVMVYSSVHMTFRKTGQKFIFPTAQVMTVDLERGVFTEFRPFYWDVKSFNEAVGHQP